MNGIFKLIKKKQRFFLYVWIGIILLLCLSPSRSLPKISWDIGIDKIAHVFLYLVLGLIGTIQYSSDQKNKYIVFILLGSFLGIIVEILQVTISDRYFELYDILANIVGIFLGVGTMYILKLKNYDLWA